MQALELGLPELTVAKQNTAAVAVLLGGWNFYQSGHVFAREYYLALVLGLVDPYGGSHFLQGAYGHFGLDSTFGGPEYFILLLMSAQEQIIELVHGMVIVLTTALESEWPGALPLSI